jgi:hypothetical protein
VAHERTRRRERWQGHAHNDRREGKEEFEADPRAGERPRAPVVTGPDWLFTQAFWKVFGEELDIKSWLAEYIKFDRATAEYEGKEPPKNTLKYRETIVGTLWDTHKTNPDVVRRVEFYREHGHFEGQAPQRSARDDPRTPEELQQYVSRTPW